MFPISIDFAEVEEIAAGRATRQRASRIRARLGDPEVIMLGVDRLDYTKGIGLRLKAFAQLLEDGRLDPARHVMVQVATPTREAVEHYKDERAEIERLVGEINGRFSRSGCPSSTTSTRPSPTTTWSRCTAPATSCWSRRSATG